MGWWGSVYWLLIGVAEGVLKVCWSWMERALWTSSAFGQTFANPIKLGCCSILLHAISPHFLLDENDM